MLNNLGSYKMIKIKPKILEVIKIHELRGMVLVTNFRSIELIGARENDSLF